MLVLYPRESIQEAVIEFKTEETVMEVNSGKSVDAFKVLQLTGSQT